MERITSKDIQSAIKSLTTGKYTGGCWYKTLATTDDGTVLCFVIGWSDGGYDQDDIDKNGYGCPDKGVCLCAKIAYQHGNNLMQSDFDWDWNVPYDKESGEAWDTDMMVPKGGFNAFDVQWYNKEARSIWKEYGKNGGLDQMESFKKGNTMKSSMQKKKESLSHGIVTRKKSEGYSEDLKIHAEDIQVTIAEVSDHDKYGRSFGLEVPTKGDTYTLPEFKQIIQDLCETSTGYADIHKAGNESILVDIQVPGEDESGEFSGNYDSGCTIECTFQVVTAALETTLAMYLDDIT